MSNNVSLTRITTLEKNNKPYPASALPHRAIKDSTYITEDHRFFVFKIEANLWAWGICKPADQFINELNLGQHAETKEKAVRNLEAYIAEEKADYKNWVS